jgi:hypothetical protein
VRYITYHGCRWYLIDLRARFEAKFQKGPGCWEWQGGINQSNGYGRFYLDRLTPFLAHRLSWALYRGPLKLCVLHKCDNRKCVRPSHLFEGTRADNNKDMCAKGRHGKSDLKGMKHPGRKLNSHEVETIYEHFTLEGFVHRQH